MPADEPDLADLRRILQALADQFQAPVLLVTAQRPTGEYRGHLPFGVLESQADRWERENVAERIVPEGGSR